MSNDEEENEFEDKSQSLEMKRHRSRMSSKRTREKEKTMMDALESERIRLYLSNTALQYHNSHLRDTILSVKNQISNPPSSVATSSSSNQPSSESTSFTRVPQNVQYNPIGITGPRPLPVLQNNLNATLPQPGFTLTPDLSQMAQANPLLPAAGAGLTAGMLQSFQQQQQVPGFQSALQAEMNRRLLPAPLAFPMAQVHPVVQPVNLAAAAAAAAALTQWQQLPPGVTPQTRIADNHDDSKNEEV